MAFDLGRFSQAWHEWWGPHGSNPIIKEMLELAEGLSSLKTSLEATLYKESGRLSIESLDQWHQQLVGRIEPLEAAVCELRARAGDLQAQVNANDRQSTDLARRVDATQEALAPLPADLAALARRFSAHLEVHRGEEEGIRRSTGTALAHRLDIVDTTLGSTVTRVEGLEQAESAHGQRLSNLENLFPHQVAKSNYGRGPELPRPLPPWESCVVYRTANAWAVSDAREVEHYGGALAWATTYVFDDMEAAGRFMHAVLTQPRDGKGS